MQLLDSILAWFSGGGNQYHRLEEELARSQEESRRKSFFLNAISHDLRTPLNGLLLHANLAEIHVEGGDHPAIMQSIAEIKTSVRLTAELLDGLLEYARLETGADQPVALRFRPGQSAWRCRHAAIMPWPFANPSR